MLNYCLSAYTPARGLLLLLTMLFIALVMIRKEPVHYTGPTLDLASYELRQKVITIKGTNRNASGLTFNADTDTLFLIVNDPPKVLELDRQGNTLREINLAGFGDTEGIIYLGNEVFAITEERKRNITRIKIAQDTREIHYRDVQPIQIIATNDPNNKGLEGLTYDRRYKHFYAVNEKRPRKLLAIPDPELSPIPLNYRELWNIEKNSMSLDDLAGIHLDHGSGNLLILSEESKRIVETTIDGKALSELELLANHSGLLADINQPEGITMDSENRLYVCSEPNLLYIFEKRKPKIALNYAMSQVSH